MNPRDIDRITPYTEEAEEFWIDANKTADLEELLGKVANYEYRNYVAMNLDGRTIEFRPTMRGTARYLGNVYMGVMEEDLFKIRNITVHEDNLCIEGICGYYGIAADEEIKVFIDVNGVKTRAKTISRDHKREHGISMRVVTFRGYFAIDPEAHGSTVRLSIKVGERRLKESAMVFDSWAPFSGKFDSEYSIQDGYIITHETHAIIVKPLPKFRQGAYIKNREKFLIDEMREKAVPNVDAVSALRSKAIKARTKKKRPLWLLSDRVDSADDNAEALFCYISKNLSNEIDAYMVIKKGTPDYERLSKIGKVVDFGSDFHKELILSCDAVIASQSYEVIRNPFGKEGYLYRDLLHNPFIIAEHGISYGKEFHTWFNRSNRMLDMVICGSSKEYDDFTDSRYEFLPCEVAATGLPRFDSLEDNGCKIITFMPSWRRSLTKGWDNVNGRWIVADDFGDSDYVRYYRNLLSDKRLNEAASRLGYSLRFKMHPVFRGTEELFDFGDNVGIDDISVPYKEVFGQSALIVTDFSSVMYDFGYLRKPIVYFQFDTDRINTDHTYTWSEGYSYEAEGFGEVETTIDGTVERLIEYMENGCVMKDEYRKRAEEFFITIDKNNCERAVAAIRNKIE